MKTTTILLVGVGGQGTILAGNLLAMTAAEAGLDVKVSEIHGMSQRGGSVSTALAAPCGNDTEEIGTFMTIPLKAKRAASGSS